MSKLKITVFCVVLGILVSIAGYFLEQGYTALSYSGLPLIRSVIFLPLWPFVYAFPPIGIILFSEQLRAIALAVLWFLIFLLYFKIYKTYLVEKGKGLFKYIPIIFVALLFLPVMFAYLNYQEDFTETCLSGKYSNALGVGSEGARYCFESQVLGSRLGWSSYKNGSLNEQAYQDTKKFCASLSDTKLAATNHNSTLGETVAPNTTYRDYCFIRLASLLSSNVYKEIIRNTLPHQIDEVTEKILSDGSEYRNVIRKVCRESGIVSGNQKEQECVDYFAGIKNFDPLNKKYNPKYQNQ